MFPFPRGPLAAFAMALLPLISSATFAGTQVIEFKGGAFVPSVLTVKAGDTLRVVNLDGTPHTFTADDGSYDSGRLMHGDATQLVLASTGTHDFKCSLGGQSVRVMVEVGRPAAHYGRRAPLQTLTEGKQN